MATTVHDVIRYLIRATGHANTAIERDLLLTVDADEQGYKDLESYKAVLAQKEREEVAAARAELAGPQAPADTTAGLTDAQLTAEIARRQTLAAAGAGAADPPLPDPHFGRRRCDRSPRGEQGRPGRHVQQPGRPGGAQPPAGDPDGLRLPAHRFAARRHPDAGG
jgi:hypothetical protein